MSAPSNVPAELDAAPARWRLTNADWPTVRRAPRGPAQREPGYSLTGNAISVLRRLVARTDSSVFDVGWSKATGPHRFTLHHPY